ncbi:hypothetical protein MJO29_011824 [Puccinia striiformis f. sp. tritici]|nr:hypothetical protein Pst134EA_022508 [Puccinia striiformis f. sp. tritici]KAH9455030.1 hypothetical protein Pst134EA_022508 [Puccinia striiformis f. sp. tritici]KAI7945436.1 hypothetical protein MJO29_011824 [Puccinia striiformis f. sp. tritici]
MGCFFIILFWTLCLTGPALLSLPTVLVRPEGDPGKFILPDLNVPLVDESSAEAFYPDQATASPIPLSATPTLRRDTTPSSSLSITTSTLRGNPVDSQPIPTSQTPRAAGKRKDHPVSDILQHVGRRTKDFSSSSTEPLYPDQATTSSIPLAANPTLRRDTTPSSSLSITASSLRGNPVDSQPIPISQTPRAAGKRKDHPVSDALRPVGRRKKEISSQIFYSVRARKSENVLSKISIKKSSSNPRKRKIPLTIDDNPAKKSRRLNQGTSSVQDLDGSGQKLYLEAMERFLVYDWNFVKLVQDSVISSNNQDDSRTDFAAKLFSTLGECRSAPRGEMPKDFFWIAREEASRKLHRYLQVKLESNFPSEFGNYDKDAEIRSTSLYDLVLRLADQKLELGTFKLFSVEMMGYVRDEVELNREKVNALRLQSKPIKRRPESKRKYRTRRMSESEVSSIMEYVENSTKVATFLVIIYLSLFGEHEHLEKGNLLSPQAVKDILTFFMGMWKKNINPTNKWINKDIWVKKMWLF